MQDKNISGIDRVAWSLIRELKQSFIYLSKKAELESTNQKSEVFANFQARADQALRMIDSYLLSAQSEHGQSALQLKASGVGVGAVVYEVVQDLSLQTQALNTNFSMSIVDGNVWANREMLRTTIWCLADMAISSQAKQVNIHTRRGKDSLRLSVLCENNQLKKSDIKKAHQIRGNSPKALSADGANSSIRLALAEQLISTFGSRLSITRRGGMRGFGFELPYSRQLQLI